MPTLNLRVTDTGSKSWVQRLTIRGKVRSLGLGGYPVVGLADARAIALQYRKLARAGGNPIVLRERAENKIPTFEVLVDEVINNHKKGWKSGGKSEAQWRASLRDYVMPALGDMLVSEITTEHVLDILLPIWASKHETAMRVRQRISMVMRYAVAKRYRIDDPAGMAISEALPKNGFKRKHMRALPYAEVEEALQKVFASEANETTKLSFKFLVLTAARSSEMRMAQWAEIDMANRTWTIPAERMKADRAHRVPLSTHAMEVLDRIRKLDYRHGLIFKSPHPGWRGRPLSDNTHSKLLRDLKIDAVPHGFRSSFRDWAAEQTNEPREIVELALAHVEGSKAELAYRRTDYFEARRGLMQQWADYLDKK